MRTLALTLGIGALAAALVFHGREAGPPPSAPSVSVLDVLGEVPADGFARVLGPRPFVFPLDHGPHPEYRTEWWYYAGNLVATDGRRFGYQVTFFRTALAPTTADRRSAWATRDVWMAHVAVTDVAAGRFHTRSRLARGALGLAGATASPFRVWLEDWAVAGAETPAPSPVMRLQAEDEDLAVDLTLTPVKPPVLHGDRGFSVKGRAPGQASHYYSLTRLDTRGRLRLAGLDVDVRGTSWMDREWSTSALGPDQLGWDWFALQLNDGRELMVYGVRHADGASDGDHREGTLVDPDGSSRPLRGDELTVVITGWWTSPRGGHRYPARWRLSVPAADLVLDVVPRVADQEWSEPVRYWEGAVEARGRTGTARVDGEGYVELVGYGESRRTRPR